MRLSERVRQWIRARVTPEGTRAIRDLRRSSDPSVRESGRAMDEAIPGWRMSLAALRPALGALHDKWESERIMAEIERDVPALVEVLTAYAMIDLPDRTREFIRAWNAGPKALQELLIIEVGRSMLAGMIVEHARQERDRGEAA